MFKTLLALLILASPYTLPHNYSVKYIRVRNNDFSEAELIRKVKLKDGSTKVAERYRLLCRCGESGANSQRCMKAIWPGDPVSNYYKDDDKLVNWLCHYDGKQCGWPLPECK